MRDIIKTIIEGVVSQGKLVGSRGAAFRASSSSDASRTDEPGKHSHGVDIGASRNSAHEKAAKEKADERTRTREREIEKRNKKAEQRKKEVAKMANEEHIEEAKGTWVQDKPLKAHVAAMEKRDTEDLKGMHSRWSGDHKDKKSDPAHSERLLAVHHVLKKRGVSVPDLPQHRNLGMMRRFTAEEAESAGTKARVKIKNVARLGDPAPTSEKSTLSKTGSIKTKIVEEKPTMSLPNFGLPASLIAAARQIVEKKHDDDDNGDAKKMEGGKTAVIIDPETDDKINEGEPKKKKHTTPKSAGEKKLAALAHPKDKITHKDVLVGRGVVKEEEVEEAIKPYVSFTAGGIGKSPSATVMGSNEKPHKTFTKTEHGSEYKQKALDYFKKHGSKLKEEKEINELGVPRRPSPAAMGAAAAKADDAEREKLKAAGKKIPASLTGVKEEEEIEEKTLYGTPDEHKRKLDRLAKQEKKLPPGISPARKALAIKKQKLQKAHSAAMGFKEELSTEELERIEAIAAQLDEAKPTIVSAPIRGANQDYRGVGTKGAVADYTISDSKKVKVKEEAELDEASPMAAPPKNRYDSADEAKAAAKKAREAGKTVKVLKHIFTNPRSGEQTHSYSVKEEVELDEGRGRPRKNPLPAGQEPAGDDTHKHPMQQLEKISHAIEGNEPHFEHKDGTKSKVGKHLAKHIVAIHNSMRTSQEKDNFAQKVHANRDSMKSEVSKHF